MMNKIKKNIIGNNVIWKNIKNNKYSDFEINKMLIINKKLE